ncbi:hypothetical protein BCR44DRAFT_351928 [Catenaria anguillulae PL171]|uniref:F-box domain-containing protein n=1 Tax=Catenaria anguillulae PL171 TaxID=765915 RepID=A0A1Y2H8H1_9FUNG|nr:hypothetical protein BCR44DRAFT_351928 [Catenaria anguillulae PL171]
MTVGEGTPNSLTDSPSSCPWIPSASARSDSIPELTTFGPATRHVRMLHGFYFDDDEFFANLADLPHLASLEVLGVADVPRECRRLFSLPTLERLVLDFECGEGTGFTPFQVHLPKLQELTISFELAAPLLEGGPNSMFPADPTTFAFPALTRLTLVDIEDRTVARQVGEFDKVPRVPFHHMPNLQNVHIPFGHRGIRNTHSIDGVTLVSLATHTRVQSFIAPGLVEIVSSEDQVAQMPVFAKHLTRVQVSHSVVDELARWIALPDADLLST